MSACRRAAAAAAVAVACACPSLAAQEAMRHTMVDGPLGISHRRMGSGTTWVPDSSPMHALHSTWGGWQLMFHGSATLQSNHQRSRRGDYQLGLIDWEMVMAMRPVGSGELHLHGMMSLEPATIGAGGYPLLLQSSETYEGQPLHDRQHPHDLLMEVAAMFEQPVARNLAVSLYTGLAGEPALGPVAYMHRPSAVNDPMAPLGTTGRMPRTSRSAWSPERSIPANGRSKAPCSMAVNRTRTAGASTSRGVASTPSPAA